MAAGSLPLRYLRVLNQQSASAKRLIVGKPIQLVDTAAPTAQGTSLSFAPISHRPGNASLLQEGGPILAGATAAVGSNKYANACCIIGMEQPRVESELVIAASKGVCVRRKFGKLQEGSEWSRWDPRNEKRQVETCLALFSMKIGQLKLSKQLRRPTRLLIPIPFPSGCLAVGTDRTSDHCWCGRVLLR